ncbi:hypothetical protein Tco_1272357 [Tanacetum coccineum]
MILHSLSSKIAKFPEIATGRMFSAASTAAMSIVENANATENIFLVHALGWTSFEPAAIILLCIWLSVEDVLTGVDMMNE